MKQEFIAHKRKSDGIIQNLSVHLTEVCIISGSLCKKFNCTEAGKLIGLLHDFGKYSHEFQLYIASATGQISQDEDDFVDAKRLKGKIDHSTAGAQLVWKLLGKYGQGGQGELCAQILALCIASHHSGLINCVSSDGDETFHDRMQKPEIKAHLQECQSKADQHILDETNSLVGKKFVEDFFQQIRSLITIASTPNQPFSTIDAFTLGLFTRCLFSCLIDADRLSSAEFEDPARKIFRVEKTLTPNWPTAIDRLETKLASFKQSTINDLRSTISDACKKRAFDAQGIYTLTVPTGGGKTLASLLYALYHAQHHDLERIIYIVPYTSIIEQNADEVRKILEREGDIYPWVLEHHSNIEPENQTWHSKLVAENWDAPIVFTTMVQLLEALFASGTRSVRRLHQLSKSVLIFDEIQTLPIQCTHMFCNALNFFTRHANTSAVLCTATQPLLNKLQSPEYGQLSLADNCELIEDKQKLFDQLERVQISNRCKTGGWTEQEICDLSLQHFNTVGSCLVVVNTKAWARQLYKLCKEEVNSDAIFHLSTNQYPAHRKQLLATIKARLEKNQPVLCISTQLIEAGVNIDFSSLIRFIAGLDSIAQAAGRCNRHGKLKDSNGNLIKGQVDVINPDNETIDYLVDIKVGQEKTKRIFDESDEFDQKDLLKPQVMTRYFDYYFFERSSDMIYPVTAKRAVRDDSLLNMLGKNSSTPSYKKNRDDRSNKRRLHLLQQSFMDAGKIFKAIDAPTQSVLICHGKGAALITELCALAKDFEASRYYATLKEAQKYSVNVFPAVWRKLQENDAVCETQKDEGIYYLKPEYYSDEFGLSTEPVSLAQPYIC